VEELPGEELWEGEMQVGLEGRCKERGCKWCSCKGREDVGGGEEGEEKLSGVECSVWGWRMNGDRDSEIVEGWRKIPNKKEDTFK